MRFLLDSDICIYSLKGESEILRSRLLDQAPGSLFISTITLAEISIGPERRLSDRHGLRGLLAVVGLMPFDVEAARIYGTLPFRRNSFDRLIAAHALALELTLVTNNEADFADVPRLKVENWTL